MRDDLSDLMGAPAAPEPAFSLDIRQVHRGVSASWLMEAFRLDRVTVRKRLADCPSIKKEGGNRPIYDFVQAAGYLVTPKLDMAKIVKSLKPEQLPNEMQKDYWDALIKKQKYELQAGELWRTEDVLETLGEVFKRIKTSMQLWVDDLDRRRGLTKEQRIELVKMVDSLQSDIHEKLVALPKSRSTPSALNSGTDDVSTDE